MNHNELAKRGVMTNLNEREHPDQSVRHNPDLLAGIIASAMDAVIAVDDAQHIVLFNAAAETVFACPANEAIGSSVERFIPQRFRAGHSTRVRRFDESGITNRTLNDLGTLWGLRSTGEEFPIEASISKVESDGKKFFTVVIRDITERHRTEEAVRESEQRFRLVADCAPALIWMSGTDKLCNYFNKPWLDFTGRSLEEELGNGWEEGVHRDDLERCLDIYTQSFDRREKFKMEYRLRRHDGKYCWVLDIGAPRFNQDRSFAGYIGIAVDVTERRLAEEALRDSEQRFRLAAQAGRMYAYTWDVTTDVIIRSGNASGVLGSTGETPPTRQQTRARVHPDDRAIFDASVSQHTPEHPDVQIRYRMLRPDGSVVWVEKTAHAMFDKQGRMERAVGMVADITERKRAEEALRESEEKFRSVFCEAGVGMVIVSPEGRYLAVNRTFCDYLGYTEEELLAKTVKSVTLPEDWPAFSQTLNESLTEGSSFQWVEKRCLHKSGRIVCTENSASVIRSREGHPQYFVAEVLDITKRKQADEALSGMTRKLVEAQEQERARIARELHDDISQRLALLAVELEQLQDKPFEVQTRLEELQKQTSEISTDVQTLAHDLHSSPLEFLGVVAGMKSWCKEFSERQRIQVDYRHDVRSNVPAEIGLNVFRILQEALHNAVKHSGVKRIEVQLHERSGEIHLTVSDLGRGFDVEAVKQGKGLGLTSMCERVRLIRGTIAIDSRPMGGTTIHVRVPLAMHPIGEVIQCRDVDKVRLDTV